MTMQDYQEAYPKKNAEELNETDILTLPMAQKLALENNPSYIAAFHAVNAAKFRYYQSLSAYLPNINYSMSAGQGFENNHNRTNPPVGVEPRERHTTTSNSLNASFLIFDGLAREFSVMIAGKDFDRNAAIDENVRRLLLRAVAYAYYDIILADERARIAKADMEFQMSSLAQAESRFRFGLVSKAAILNFKILANAARSSMLNAQYQAEVSRFALTALMGFSTMEKSKKLKLTPLEIETQKLEGGIGFYLDTAIANRPDLRAYRYLLDIARYKKYQAFSGFLPVISLFSGLGIETNSGHFGGAAYRHDYYNAATFNYGVRAEWNLFSGFSTYNLVRERRALEQEASFQVENTFLNCVNEVQSAYANYENAYEQVQIYHQMLTWVFEQRKLVAVEYWGGKETITRLNGAQSDLVNAEAKLAIAMVELNKSIAQLNAAVNMPLETEIMHEIEAPRSGTPLEKLLEELDRQFQ